MGEGFVQTAEGQRRLADALTLVVIVALSALPYIVRLGFYSDDWGLLAAFEAAARSGHSVVAATLPDYGVRPVQGVYLALLYEAFGLRPLGYHLVNTAVIAGCVALLYLLLLRLRFTRGEAFAAALVFALMPQLSTVRVWFATFQIPLSMIFALVSMHALLSFERFPRTSWAALAATVAAAALCIAAYEIFAPLIAGFAAALLFLQLRAGNERFVDPRRALGPLAALATIGAGVALKFLTERSQEFAGGDCVRHSGERHRPTAVARLEFVERFWAETPALQQQVIVAARTDLAWLPPGSTVILDGICPYHGPAIVFETYWGIAGALSLALDRQIFGGAVSPRMRLSATGLDSEIYGEPVHYGFGPNLFIYNPARHRLARLVDAEAAHRYFSTSDRPPMRCPTGYVGQGVLV